MRRRLRGNVYLKDALLFIFRYVLRDKFLPPHVLQLKFLEEEEEEEEEALSRPVCLPLGR